MARPIRKDDRPQIWAEGSQKPPFQPRAFALASVIFARESLSGLLDRCATSANDLGQTVATGRWQVPAHRLGRTGRYLPSVATTAATITGTAGILRRSAQVITPDATAAVPMASIFDAPQPAEVAAAAIPARVQRAPSPAERPTPRAADAVNDDPELAAIRAMLETAEPTPMPQTPPNRALPDHTAAPSQKTDVPQAGLPGWRRELLATGAATGLGYGLLAMALPVGITRALIAHLGGEDLREMVSDRQP